jgi:3-hexulose-6-phosphate synthase
VSNGSLVQYIKSLPHPALQVALDFTEEWKPILLSSALSRAQLGEGIIIEAGTPLIKSAGKLIVRLLKAAGIYPVLADTKTADVGSLEARLFCGEGASAITVLAGASDSTIRDALKEATSLGCSVIVDTVDVETDLISRVERLASLGVEAVNIHMGIDVQKATGGSVADLIDMILEVRKLVPILSVSGGIKLNDITRLAEASPDIIVVGSAITRAEDPIMMARKFLSKIREVFKK